MWTFKMYSRNVKTTNEPTASNNKSDRPQVTGTCFIQKIYSPSASLLQGKYLPFSPSPLRLNIFRLFVILSLTQLYRYTPEIFLFSTATFKYKYPPPLEVRKRRGHIFFEWNKCLWFWSSNLVTLAYHYGNQQQVHVLTISAFVCL